MSKPYIHALSSVKKFGGEISDYLDIHTFLDSSKSAVASNAHRALTHNSWFISTVIPRVFGEVFKRPSDGKMISSRDIAEQHVAEDYANQFIPSAQDFLENMEFKDWMQNGQGAPPSFAKILGTRRIIREVPLDEKPLRSPKVDVVTHDDGTFRPIDEMSPQEGNILNTPHTGKQGAYLDGSTIPGFNPNDRPYYDGSMRHGYNPDQLDEVDELAPLRSGILID